MSELVEIAKITPDRTEENTAIGIKALHKATSAKRCICLGNRAGEWIIDEDYQFCLTTSGKELVEFKTTMTEYEWHVIHTVIRRALLKGTILDVARECVLVGPSAGINIPK